MAGDGDFLAILRFVGKISQWVLELMLDLLCVCVLVLPMVLPWRFVALCCSIARACDQSRGDSCRVAFRFWAVFHFGAALLDICMIPFAIICWVSPLRWCLLVQAIVRGLCENNRNPDKWQSNRILYDSNFRWLWCRQCFEALFDVFCLVFGIVAVIHPWRVYETLRGVLYIIKEPRAEASRQKIVVEHAAKSLDVLQDWWNRALLSPLRWWLLQNGAMCLLDWPMWILGLISILMPTRSMFFFRCFCYILKEKTLGLDYGNNCYCQELRIETVDWPSLWALCLLNFVAALLDVATLPFSIFAVMSPVRFYRLVEDVYLRRSCSPPKCELHSDRFETVVLRKTWKCAGGAHVYKGCYSDASKSEEVEIVACLGALDEEERISSSLSSVKRCVVGRCYTKVNDKATDVWHILVRSKNSGEEMLLSREMLDDIKKQKGASRSPADVKNWSSTKLASDTIRRVTAKWGFGGEPIDFLDIGCPYDQGLRLAFVRNGAQALADILFLPFMLIVTLSMYRTRPLLVAIANVVQHKKDNSLERDTYAKNVLGIRTETLRQFLLLLLDVVTFPGLLIVLLTGYRSRGLWNNMGSNFNHFHCQLHGAIIKNTFIVFHDVVLLAPSLLLLCTLWRNGCIWKACGLILPDKVHVASNDTTSGTAFDDTDGADVARHLLAQADPQWAALAGVDVETIALAEPSVVVALPDEMEFPGTVRPMIWVEFLKLLRDLLLIPIFLLTLHRLPSVLIKLCARAGKPVGGDPLCRVERMRVSVVDRVGVSIEVRLSSTDELQLDKGSLKINPLGKQFWIKIGREFGSNIAAFAQGMTPLAIKPADTDAYDILAAPTSTEVEDGRQNGSSLTDAYDGGQDRRDSSSVAQVRTFTMSIPSKVKRTTIEKNLRKLGPVSLRVQLEASIKGKKCLLAVANAQVSDMLSAAVDGPAQGTFVEMPRRDEEVEIGEHVSMQNAYWTIVGLEFFQVLLDFFHLILLVPIIILPWRLYRLIVCVFEPKERWPLRVCVKALRDFRDAEWLLDRFRADFVPRCNELLKSQQTAKRWHLGSMDLKLHSRDLIEHAGLSRSIHAAVDEVPSEFQQPLQHCLELQDARLYHVALRSYAHCSLSQSEMSIEEHATILEQIAATESRLAAVQERAVSSLEDQVQQARMHAYQRGWNKCGFWRKDMGLLRKIIRRIATTQDLLGVVLFFLLIVTVYRLPMACAELLRERACNPVSTRFRLIIKWHLKVFAEEVMLAVQVFLLFIALVGTLVRLPEAVRSLGYSSSLRDMRDNLLNVLDDALSCFYEFFSLFTLWRTYSFVFRAVAQSVLVVPACLTELIGMFSSCLPFGLRFLLGVLAAVGLCVLPFLGSSGRLGFLVSTAVVLFASCWATARKEGAAEIKGWSAPSLRWTWLNLVAIGALVIEPTCMILTLSTFPSAEYAMPDMGSSFFGSDVRHSVCEMTGPLVIGASSVAGVWLLLLSLMFVTGQSSEHAALQSNTFLRFLQLLFSHVLLVPVSICLLLPTACGDSDLKGLSLCFFACYVVTTQALSIECGLLEPAPASGGLDLRYPSRYSSLSQTLSIGLCIASCWQGTADVIVAVSLASLSFVLTALYPCIFGAMPCSVPYVVPLRCGGSFIIFATTAFICYQRYIATPLSASILYVTWLSLLCLTVLATIARGLSDRRRRRRELQQSGILQGCRMLVMETEAALCHGEVMMRPNRQLLNTNWQKNILEATSAQKLALHLLELEKRILVEWLTFDFLEHREAWCKSLREANSFEDLRTSILLLRAGIRTPPTQSRITKCLSKVLQRDDLSDRVLQFVTGYPELKSLLQPALFCAKTSKKIGSRCGCLPKGGKIQMRQHLDSARLALKDVLQRFNATSATKEVVGVTPVLTGDSFLNVLMEPSHPQMYYPHLNAMLTSAGRIIDNYGEPHATLPRGLAVGRVLPRCASSWTLAGPKRSLSASTFRRDPTFALPPRSEIYLASNTSSTSLDDSIDIPREPPLQPSRSVAAKTSLQSSPIGKRIPQL